jgi:HK97 family phage major capsid protein
MKKKSQEVAGRILAKRQELEQIFAAHKDEQGTLKAMPEDVLAEVKKRQVELKGLNSELGQTTELEQLEEENLKAMAELKSPQYNVPLGPAELQSIEEKAAGLKAGEVDLAGFRPAGATYIETEHDAKRMQLKRLSVAYEEGDLGFDTKMAAAISSTNYKHVFRNYLRKGFENLPYTERKTLQEGSDAAGGFLVPEDILNAIIQKTATPTRIAGMVTQLQTSRDALNIPKVNYSADDKYTTGIRVKWTGEIPATSTTHRVNEPVFGMVRIPIHTAMLSMPLTNDMVEDAAFPIVAWSTEKFTETYDLLKDDMIINGNAQGQPGGILLNPGGTDQPAIVKTGDANLVTADGLIALGYALPEQYDLNARYILNKTVTGKAIALLKDLENRYLFGMGTQDSGLVSGRPTMLNGYPYAYSAFMPDIAANAFPVIFGDLRGYYLVNRFGFSIQVLRELYAETNQIVVLGRVRFGGQVAEPYKLKVQKVAA